MNNWYAYEWELDNVPGTFQVDLDYAEEFDTLGDFTTLLFVACHSLYTDSAAFTPSEMRKLDAVLAGCRKLLGQKAVYVGNVDAGVLRKYFFYTSDARVLVPLMNYCAEVKAFRVECGKSPEPERQTYYTLLLPDATRRQAVDNGAYVRSMAALGDDVSARRRITLHFFFPTARSRESFSESALSQGFAIGADDFLPDAACPYYLAVHRIAPLDPAALTRLTTAAIGIAGPLGGLLEHLDAVFVRKRKW